jgi:hypothetical protein
MSTYLPSSGPLSILDIKNLFGGPASPSLSNYYRGGGYIPATKTVSSNVREPSSGNAYSASPPYTYWLIVSSSATTTNPNNSNFIYWNYPSGSSAFYSGPFGGAASTYTSSGVTYYFSNVKRFGWYSCCGFYQAGFELYRTYTTTVTVSINTGIPSSGTISLSQFYGAEKP